MRVIRHIIRWNKWRKGCLNSWFYKFLVLIGVKKSPTMALIFLDDEEEEFKSMIERALSLEEEE